MLATDDSWTPCPISAGAPERSQRYPLDTFVAPCVQARRPRRDGLEGEQILPLRQGGQVTFGEPRYFTDAAVKLGTGCLLLHELLLGELV